MGLVTGDVGQDLQIAGNLGYFYIVLDATVMPLLGRR
jgi:hypothetical protein